MQDAPRRGALGVALVITSACAYGTVPIIAKDAFAHGVSLPEFLTLRFTLAAAMLWCAVPLSRGSLPRPADGVRLFFLGAIGYGVQSAAFFLALTRLPASTTALLLYTYPTIVTLGAAVLFHDRLTVRKIVAILIGFAGTTLVVRGQTGPADLSGVGFALASAAVYSGYILFGSRFFVGVPPLAGAATVMTGTAFSFLAYTAIGGRLSLLSDPLQGAIITLAAVLGTALPVLAFLAGMPRIGPSRAALLSTFEPVVTVILAAAALGEAFQATQIAGAACVLASVIVLEWGRSGEPARM